MDSSHGDSAASVYRAAIWFLKIFYNHLIDGTFLRATVTALNAVIVAFVLRLNSCASDGSFYDSFSNTGKITVSNHRCPKRSAQSRSYSIIHTVVWSRVCPKGHLGSIDHVFHLALIYVGGLKISRPGPPSAYTEPRHDTPCSVL